MYVYPRRSAPLLDGFFVTAGTARDSATVGATYGPQVARTRTRSERNQVPVTTVRLRAVGVGHGKTGWSEGYESGSTLASGRYGAYDLRFP
jgi:hypothetical protein